MAFGAGQTEGKCAGFERVALDLQRDQYIQNLASGFQPLDWDGREEFAGRAGGCGLARVGCKGESAPRTTANPFFYFYFILSASFRRQLENKNSKSCVLSTAGNHEGKKKTQKHFWKKNPEVRQDHQPTGWPWIQGLKNQDLIDEMKLKSAFTCMSFILFLCLNILHLLWSKLTQMVKGWTRWSWRSFSN